MSIETATPTRTELETMLADTRRLRTGFANTAERAWEATTAATELLVQLGHLAGCIRSDTLGDPVVVDPARPITDVGDELADVVLATLSVWTLSADPTNDHALHQARAVAHAAPDSDPSTAALRLIGAAGTLAEVAMVDSGFRHRPEGESPPLPGAVAATLAACDALAHTLQLDLAAEFARMVDDAENFLAVSRTTPDIGGRGAFSTQDRSGSSVRKRLDIDGLAGRPLPDPVDLRRYIDTVRAAGVRLPADLVAEPRRPLAVTHTWVEGPMLDRVATTCPETAVQPVRQIAHWMHALDGTDARIDTNLANFCLVDGIPVLIDVLPPLIVSQRTAPQNLFEELFDSLCFDTPVTLHALLGYTLTRLLAAGPDGRAAATALDDLTAQALSAPVAPGLAGSWFRAKLLLATRCVAGEVDAIQLDAFSAAVSVRAFHKLAEPARHVHVRAVRDRIADLDLETTA